MASTRTATRSSSRIQNGSQVVNHASSSATSERPSKRLKRDASNVSQMVESQNTQNLIEECDEDSTFLETSNRVGKQRASNLDRASFLQRVDIPWSIGAHVSAAGGVQNAPINAAIIGANAFALFLKSQRKWTSPPLTGESISQFKANMREYGYDPRHVIPHGSYLINLANPDPQKREKSYECFLDDLKRCEALGLEMYNFHPGSTVGACTVEEAITSIAGCINDAHKATQGVSIVLENMAGAGNIIGGDFVHLSGIIAKIDDKSRIGVCFDTCHAFAAGYDIRTKEGWNSTMDSFEKTVGLKYLRAFHLNDSKCGLGSHKDRHESIGQGELSLLAFQHIVSDERTKGIPMVLETPSFEMPKEVWGVEINVLGRLSLFATKPKDSDNTADSDAQLVTLGGLREEIQVAVKAAEVKNGKNKGRRLTSKSEGKGKKRKRPSKDKDGSGSDSSCG